MSFKIENTFIEGVKIISPRLFEDSRGYFMETYKLSCFKEAGIEEEFVQANESFSTKNTLRGIHYQLDPNAQGKLVRVVQGRALDVAVDLRKDSPTFGKWLSVELTGENKKLIYIPPGMGHGFLALSETMLFSYMCTAEYNQESERGIIWNDPDLEINWRTDNPVLSDKDMNLSSFEKAEF